MSANPESLTMLIAMGFQEEEASLALIRANNDLNMAIEILSGGGTFEGGDEEFDLLPPSDGSLPAVQEPTIFQPRTSNNVPDHFAANITEGTVAEIVDARISSLTEMGFSSAQAEEALRRCNNDVNEALNVLLSSGN